MERKLKQPRTLEGRIKEFLSDFHPESTFDVIAYRLTMDRRCGWEVNDHYYLKGGCDLDEALYWARIRWEMFKRNYWSRARVKNIQDEGSGSSLSLEVDGIPFLGINVNEPESSK